MSDKKCRRCGYMRSCSDCRGAQPTPTPTPVKHDSRIAFGIDYFKTDAEARAYGEKVKQRGDRYNGGYFDGMPCGRDTTYDYVDPELGPLFAVTVR